MNKKYLKAFTYLLTAAVIVLCSPAVTAAEDILSIDNANLYREMYATYSDGYMPMYFGGDYVDIVLPLISSETFTDNKIKASVNLGATANSPFIFKTYEKDFFLETHDVNNGKGTQSAFLVKFELNLVSDFKSGAYPVTVNVTGAAESGEVSRSFTLYVNLPAKDEQTAEPDENEKSPLTIDIESENVYTGMNAAFSKGYKPAVKDGKVTVVLPLAVGGTPDGKLTVVADAGTASPFIAVNQRKNIESLRYDWITEKYIYVAEFTFELKEDFNSGTYAVNFAVSGTGTDGAKYSANFSVYVSVEAAEEEEEEEEEEEKFSLSIANDKKYSGMNNTYQDGYVPTIKNDTATVIIPLAPKGEYDGEITVSSRTTDSTVFSGVNYNKAFAKRSDGYYLVRFELPLNEERRNGAYPVEFTVTGDDMTFNFTVYVIITDEKAEEANGFYIENENVYGNMELSYSNGYKPTLSGNKATVILPLKAKGEMKGDLTVKADISDNTNETFEIRNYIKNVSVTDGVYVTRFDFNLLDTRKNGVYAVKFTVSGVTAADKTVEESFTVYITVSDGEEESESETPNVIVESYKTEEYYTAGDEINSTVVLKNVKKNTKAQNLQIRISTQSQGIETLGGTNMIFFEEMNGDSLEFDLKLRALRDAATGKHSINLDITYEDENGQSRNSSAVLYLYIRQTPEVEFETGGLESRITAGDTVTLTIDVYNMGKSNIYNAALKVEGHGLLPNKTGYLGTVNAESGESADIDIFVGSKTMSGDYDGEEKYGYTEGKVTLTYEDAEGNEYSDEYKISTQIDAPASTDASSSEVETDSSWWISLLAGGCILIFTGVLFIANRNYKKWSSS